MIGSVARSETVGQDAPRESLVFGKYLLAEGVAARAHVAVGTVYQWIHKGWITPRGYLHGYRPLFLPTDVDQLAQRKRKERRGRAPSKNRSKEHGTQKA